MDVVVYKRLLRGGICQKGREGGVVSLHDYWGVCGYAGGKCSNSFIVEFVVECKMHTVLNEKVRHRFVDCGVESFHFIRRWEEKVVFVLVILEG